MSLHGGSTKPGANAIHDLFYSILEITNYYHSFIQRYSSYSEIYVTNEARLPKFQYFEQ